MKDLSKCPWLKKRVMPNPPGRHNRRKPPLMVTAQGHRASSVHYPMRCQGCDQSTLLYISCIFYLSPPLTEITCHTSDGFKNTDPTTATTASLGHRPLRGRRTKFTQRGAKYFTKLTPSHPAWSFGRGRTAARSVTREAEHRIKRFGQGQVPFLWCWIPGLCLSRTVRTQGKGSPQKNTETNSDTNVNQL